MEKSVLVLSNHGALADLHILPVEGSAMAVVSIGRRGCIEPIVERLILLLLT